MQEVLITPLLLNQVAATPKQSASLIKQSKEVLNTFPHGLETFLSTSERTKGVSKRWQALASHNNSITRSDPIVSRSDSIFASLKFEAVDLLTEVQLPIQEQAADKTGLETEIDVSPGTLLSRVIHFNYGKLTPSAQLPFRKKQASPVQLQANNSPCFVSPTSYPTTASIQPRIGYGVYRKHVRKFAQQDAVSWTWGKADAHYKQWTHAKGAIGLSFSAKVGLLKLDSHLSQHTRILLDEGEVEEPQRQVNWIVLVVAFIVTFLVMFVVAWLAAYFCGSNDDEDANTDPDSLSERRQSSERCTASEPRRDVKDMSQLPSSSTRGAQLKLSSRGPQGSGHHVGGLAGVSNRDDDFVGGWQFAAESLPERFYRYLEVGVGVVDSVNDDAISGQSFAKDNLPERFYQQLEMGVPEDQILDC